MFRPFLLSAFTAALAALCLPSAAFTLAGCSAMSEVRVPSASVATPPAASASVPAPPAPVVRARRATLAGLPPDSLLAPDCRTLESAWVDSTLASMTLREKIAQLIIPFTYSDAEGAKRAAIIDVVRDCGVGGVIISRGSVAEARRLTRDLQGASRIPLLISADFENGLAMRLDDATAFPSAMALGAAGSIDLAYEMGRAVAAEARSVGVQQNYAPVCDVNNNPDNPIINVRSFGESPALVARMAAAYARGMQDGGILATAKHFPGHGDTDTDSHLALPVVPYPSTRIDSLELVPFQRLVESGVLSVMTGHIAVPAIDPDRAIPASLSRKSTDSLLRGVLGFHGLVVTDALNMAGLARASHGRSPASMALAAGADMLLMPTDPRDAIEDIRRDISTGALDTSLLDRAVRRVLCVKDWLGLSRVVNPPIAVPASDVFGRDTHRALARRIARTAVTLVRNERNTLPLSWRGHHRAACLSLPSGRSNGRIAYFQDALRDAFPDCTFAEAGRSVTPGEARRILDSMREKSIVFVAGFIKVAEGTGVIALSDQQRKLVERIHRNGAKIVLLSFGSPYILRAVPQASACLNAYGEDEPSIDAVVSALYGGLNPSGTLPIGIPGIADAGFGLRYPGDPPEAVANAAWQSFADVDRMIQDQIRNGAFPGAQLIVQRHGRIVHARNFGRLTYQPLSPLVTSETMYDLASVSKVVATTTAAMMLYDQGRLALDATVASYLPEFAQNGKARITIRNLLVHNSGLPAFCLFYKRFTTAKEVVDSIMHCGLDYPTGSRTVYSDLGMITLGKVIERITGTTLDAFAQREIFRPLGMAHTMYNPPDLLKPYAAPTENDTYWRMRVVQGTVHDETAALLDGVAGHAGVFSNASDLAVFAQMLLDGGTHDGARLVKKSTVDLFTRRQGRESSRGLGWDMRSSENSSAGRYFSMRSFGHTGFTGTSIWIDPDADMFVIFLTNRVYPTRENKKLLGFRAVLHDAIREVKN